MRGGAKCPRNYREVQMMADAFPELAPPQRILMGPGPSNVDPRVLRAMSTPVVGHLDPEFLTIADRTMQLLRYVFQTENHFTLPVSGTGSAGMEAALCNVVEPGDEVLVCVAGLFGERMCDVAARCGAEVARVDVEWGRVIAPEQVEDALKSRPAKVVAIVHAETSTGAWQPLDDIARIAHDHAALLLVDAVTSLGGCPVGGGRARHGHLLLRHAEMPELPARPGADHLQRPRG